MQNIIIMYLFLCFVRFFCVIHLHSHEVLILVILVTLEYLLISETVGHSVQ